MINLVSALYQLWVPAIFSARLADLRKGLLMLLFIMSAGIGFSQASDFVTKWDLSKTGTAGNNSISFFTTNAAGAVAYTWQELSPGSSSGSGSFSAGTAASRSLTGLPANAIIELRMAASNLQRFYINNGTDKSRLIDVMQWGSTGWISMENMFRDCDNLNITSTDLPDMAAVTSMELMFAGCTILNGPVNIGNWNTSAVTNMEYTFGGASAFNQNISNWNTGNVTTMISMFRGATSFNQNIGNWNTANATNMAGMFLLAAAFNQNIGNWNTANVTRMEFMFQYATAFNQNIGNWNTANVTNMSYMFRGATSFNQNIGNWNTANVTNMIYMFYNASAFNQDIGNWNTASVTSMSLMFQYASAFNQNIGNWNTANVTSMHSLFSGAAAFNQNLGNWLINNSVDIRYMLDNCALDCENYSLTLAGWANSTNTTGRSLGAAGLTYGTNVSAFRSILTGTRGWTITGDAVSSGACGPTVFYSKSTGNLDDLATWGANTNGTGTAPFNFTNANQIFCIRNRSTASLGANWSVSGTKSLVILGDASTAITVSTGSNTLSGNFKLTNNATLEIGSNSSGIILTCENGSTVNYNGNSAQSIATGNYFNLSISNSRGGATLTLASGSIEVRNTFTVSATNVGSWAHTGNTFVYCGSGAQTIAALDYNNLIISGVRTSTPNITLPSGTIRVFGNAYLSSFGAVNWVNSGNTVEYAGNGAQQIGAYFYNNLSISGNKNSGNFTLEYGDIGAAQTVSVSATNISGWTNTGNTFIYNGSSAQTVAPEIVYRNLTIAGSNAKTLGGNTIVEGDLALSSNKLVLSQYSLTLFGSVTGAGGSNYVQTGSTGTLNKTLNTGSSFLFPVGNSAYNPVSITNNTGAADLFNLRVLDEVYYQGTTGLVSSKPRVKRTWLINKTNPNAGSGVDFVFNWNAGEATAGISAYKLYHYDGSAWQKQTGTTSTVGTSLTYTGYTGTFSPFAIGDDIVLLPVSWLYMRCNSAIPGSNTIQWATASQTNSRSFVVERSSNGKSFVALDSLAAAGNSHNANHYSYVDEHADLPEAYYRIKQVDENGSEHLSEICLVQTKSSKNSPMVSIYPNPAASVVFLSAGEKSQPYNWALYNTTGQLLASGSSDGGQASINLSNIGKGIYNLHIQGEGFLQNVKLLVNP